MLITFSNNLDPDQARQFVGPDLDPNCLTLMAFTVDFFNSNFEKNQLTTVMEKFPACKELILVWQLIIVD